MNFYMVKILLKFFQNIQRRRYFISKMKSSHRPDTITKTVSVKVPDFIQIVTVLLGTEMEKQLESLESAVGTAHTISKEGRV